MTYDPVVDQWLGSDPGMGVVEWLYHVYGAPILSTASSLSPEADH